MRRFHGFLMCLLIAGAHGCGSPAVERRASGALPTNVVLLVGDGFGVGAWTLAREWARASGVETVLDTPEALGFLTPHYDGGLVTDSAAASTAWSAGRLVPRFTIGADGKAPLFVDLANAGWSCGFVTTMRVTHATPAPFYAVTEHRDNEDEIAAQLVGARLPVAIGGGARHFLPDGDGGSRGDDRNLVHEAELAGITVLREFHAPLPPGAPVLGLLAPSHLPHEIDRGDGPDLPELAVAAIRRLQAEGRPWFLLVEEGSIDLAAHDFDAPSIAFDGVRLDRTVRAVLDATDRATTLVIVTADHATSNPVLLESARPESLGVVRASVRAMEQQIFEGESWNGTPDGLEEKALPIVDRGAGLTHLSPEDLDRLVAATNAYDRAAALGLAVSRRFGITFLPYDDLLRSDQVHGHTADLVPIRAWGPRAQDVRGVADHARIGRWLREVTRLPAAPR